MSCRLARSSMTTAIDTDSVLYDDGGDAIGEALRSAALVATASHDLPGDQILAVTPVPPWGAPGAAGVSLTRRNFWQLSVKPCDCSGSPAEQHLVQRPRLTDQVVNAVLELEEARRKQLGDRTTLILSSFFMESLGGTRGQPYHYERVRRWHSARKLQVRCGVSSVMELRRILVPVNVPYRVASHQHNARAVRVLKQQQGLKEQEQEEQEEQQQEQQQNEDHWVLAEIEPANCSVRVYDSADAGTLTQASWDVLRALRRWAGDASQEQPLVDEIIIAPSAPVDIDRDCSWTLERGDSPQRQDFTGDCGVYMLANACILARAGSYSSDSESSCPRNPTPVMVDVYSEADIPWWRTTFAAKLLGASVGYEADR